MRKEIFKFLVLLLVAAGAGPASSQVWQWSHTAATNASVDPTINWAEGQAPSTINDSSRAEMARLAEFRDDISGVNVLTGTSTAYVLATQAAAGGNGLCSGSTSLTDGQMIAFRVNVTNDNAAAITVDNCASYPLQATAGVALPAASIIGGTPYRASFNLAQSAWVMEAIYGNPYNVPLGGMMLYTGTSAPNSNFILPAGQCLSTTTYAAYYSFLGSPSQGACSSGQWPLAVDMRGKVPAGLDNLNGTAANILTSSSTGCGTAMTSVGAVCANGVQSSSVTLAQLPAGITSNGATSYGGKSIATYLSPSPVLASTFTSNVPVVYDTGGSSNISFSTAGTASVTSNNTGGVSRPSIQPTIGVSFLLRVI